MSIKNFLYDTEPHSYTSLFYVSTFFILSLVKLFHQEWNLFSFYSDSIIFKVYIVFCYIDGK